MAKTKINRKKSKRALMHDFLMIALGIIIALVLVRIGFLDFAVRELSGYGELSSFIAGMFFTSAFTIAPASVALAKISEAVPTHTMVLWGGLGAVFGDLILFFFIRDRFAKDLTNSLKPSLWKHVFNSFHLGFLKWISPILGALIIASPFPDEFGLALMGFSRTKLIFLIPISFVMNMLGVYAIVWFAHLI